MNPIPLSAPGGRVYAYACGVCHNVHADAFFMGPWPADGPHETEMSLSSADRCCMCSGCRVGPVETSLCDSCSLSHRSNHMWRSIACCMLNGFTTEEQLDAYLSGDDE